METPEQQLASLSPEQRRLVERWLRQEQDATSTPSRSRLIPRRHAADVIPLSFAQQRLWFLHQLEPASSAYHFRTVIRLVGRLDITLLARSLNAIVQRHEVLRTTFRFADGQLRQLIAPALPLPLPLLDLGCLPPDLRDAQVQRLALHAITQPFDLEHGPLLRAALLRLAPDAHVLLLPMHHIITDGWSQGVQLRELAALYAALGAGAPSPLPELPIQFADYALWQRTWLQGSGVRGQAPGVRSQESGVRSQESDAGASQTQNSKLKTQNLTLEAQLAYWKQQLAGLSPLDLPIDRPRPPQATHHGALAYLTFPARVLEALKGLSRREGVTLFMTLLAALDVLLYRYTGQSDIVVGSPVAGRTRSELEGLIGLFVNMLALRTDLGGDPRFGELLRRVRKVALEAYAHQEAPFEQVIEKLELARDVGHNPAFEVMLVLQNSPMPALEAAGLSLQPLEVATSTAVLDLSLYLREMTQGLQVRAEYNSDLFDAATIGRLLGHLQVLLEGIASDPFQPISQLPLLSVEERHQLLVAWNATDTAYPQECCIHQLFEVQAARTPDAVALVFDRPTTNDQRPTTNDREPRTKNQESGTDDESKTQNSKFKTQNSSPNTQHPTPNTQCLTYRELNRRANYLAHHLRSLGVGAETLVGLCVERSLTMVVGVLGILKAGAAYLPLDPAYPPKRLTFMLEDARPQVMLTTTDDRRPTTDDRPTTNDQRLQSKIQNPKSKIVNLHADWSAIARMPANNPHIPVTPDNAAYIIYTSGSTGVPKGVLGLHRGVVNRIRWMADAYPFAPGEVACQKTALSFVDAVAELFGPLLLGIRLVVIPDALLADAGLLLGALAAERVSRIVLVPSLLSVLLESVPDLDARLSSLICWSSSGEALAVELYRRFRERLPRAVLLNLYGSSEVAADATWYETRGEEPGHGVPIGRPIANMQVYVLDAHMQLVPIGASGELYVGGAGLARGYLNRPDLTAERFVPNPFWGMGDKRSAGGGLGWGMEDSLPILHPPSPIPRLYRTGDLARWRADGNLEFLGRIDQQIKIRGFRIEPGEIEAALGQHPAVCAAVVVAREDVPGDRRLVAYVVPEIEDRGLKIEDSASDAPDRLSAIGYRLSSELRDFLKDKLPDYMVPTAFVVLEALPLNVSGKIDRSRLPAPGRGRFGLESAFVTPRTRAEATLAAIWAAVLGHERIGVHDNFFALGGDSIRSIQVIARARQAGCDLTPSQIFRHQTIAELAAAIGTAGGAQAEQGLVIGPVPFLPVQLWFFERNLPPPYHWFISSLLQVERPLETGWLREALCHLLAHHDGLRMRVVREAGGWRQFIAAPATTMPLCYYDLSGLPESAHSAAIIAAAAQAQADLSLADGPIMRVALMQLGAGRPARLLLVMHHLLGDAVSWQIVLEDLQTAYRQLSRGEPIQLPPKTSSLRQLSTRLAEYAGSDAARQGLEQYWLARPWHKVLPLPVDYPNGLAANTAESTRAIAVTLSAAETDALRRALRRHDAQIMELLLAALGLALAPWTGSSALLVDVVGHGRETVFEDLDLSRTVGWLTVALPVLIDLEDARDPAAALRAVKRQLPHLSTRGIEYQSLRYLSPDPAVRASLAALPPYEIVFNYLGQTAEPAPEAGSIRPAPEAARVADLAIPPGFMRQSLLHCSGAIRAGRLALSLKYSVHIHRHETIERLAQAFAAALRELIAES